MPDLLPGPDGLERCAWATSAPEYLAYHDEEWGWPVDGEASVLERLCLEGFQSGLSWLTILRKREGFRRAFAAFEPDVVAGFGAADVERLLRDPSIVRHRGKIEATIANARATILLHEQGTTLAEIVWGACPGTARAPEVLADIPSSTPGSKELARRLRAAGFRFVGPTTVYAAMQALGVVDDHLVGCAARAGAESARKRDAQDGPGEL